MFGLDDAALATVLAGIVSTAGGLYMNKKNVDANDYANKVNWDIARQNNATQIEMANTAHQREVADLRAAGLNPILSAGGNGSSTPTLSTASINPYQQSNAFEGLANSAKGLGRYLSMEYKNNLDMQRAQVTSETSKKHLMDSQTFATDLENKMSQLENQRQMIAFQADQGNVYADQIESQIRKVATMAETGIDLQERDGVWHPHIYDYGKFKNAVELEREGLRSDMKKRSNANWRANLSSFVPFVSPAAINSARNATRATVPAYRRGMIP